MVFYPNPLRKLSEPQKPDRDFPQGLCNVGAQEENVKQSESSRCLPTRERGLEPSTMMLHQCLQGQHSSVAQTGDPVGLL